MRSPTDNNPDICCTYKVLGETVNPAPCAFGTCAVGDAETAPLQCETPSADGVLNCFLNATSVPAVWTVVQLTPAVAGNSVLEVGDALQAGNLPVTLNTNRPATTSSSSTSVTSTGVPTSTTGVSSATTSATSSSTGSSTSTSTGALPTFTLFGSDSGTDADGAQLQPLSSNPAGSTSPAVFNTGNSPVQYSLDPTTDEVLVEPTNQKICCTYVINGVQQNPALCSVSTCDLGGSPSAPLQCTATGNNGALDCTLEATSIGATYTDTQLVPGTNGALPEQLAIGDGVQPGNVPVTLTTNAPGVTSSTSSTNPATTTATSSNTGLTSSTTSAATATQTVQIFATGSLSTINGNQLKPADDNVPAAAIFDLNTSPISFIVDPATGRVLVVPGILGTGTATATGTQTISVPGTTGLPFTEEICCTYSVNGQQQDPALCDFTEDCSTSTTSAPLICAAGAADTLSCTLDVAAFNTQYTITQLVPLADGSYQLEIGSAQGATDDPVTLVTRPVGAAVTTSGTSTVPTTSFSSTTSVSVETSVEVSTGTDGQLTSSTTTISSSTVITSPLPTSTELSLTTGLSLTSTTLVSTGTDGQLTSSTSVISSIVTSAIETSLSLSTTVSLTTGTDGQLSSATSVISSIITSLIPTSDIVPTSVSIPTSEISSILSSILSTATVVPTSEISSILSSILDTATVLPTSELSSILSSVLDTSAIVPTSVAIPTSEISSIVSSILNTATVVPTSEISSILSSILDTSGVVPTSVISSILSSVLDTSAIVPTTTALSLTTGLSVTTSIGLTTGTDGQLSSATSVLSSIVTSAIETSLSLSTSVGLTTGTDGQLSSATSVISSVVTSIIPTSSIEPTIDSSVASSLSSFLSSLSSVETSILGTTTGIVVETSSSILTSVTTSLASVTSVSTSLSVGVDTTSTSLSTSIIATSTVLSITSTSSATLDVSVSTGVGTTVSSVVATVTPTPACGANPPAYYIDSAGGTGASTLVRADFGLGLAGLISSATYTTIATIAAAGTPLNALGYNFGNGLLYAALGAAPSTLISINPVNGIVTTNGSLGLTTTATVGTIDENGQYWLTDATNSRFTQVDLLPGSSTFGQIIQSNKVPTATALNGNIPLYVGDWTYLPGTGQNALYGIAYSNTGGLVPITRNFVVRFDRSTGAFSTVQPGLPDINLLNTAGRDWRSVYSTDGGLIGAVGATGTIFATDYISGDTYSFTVLPAGGAGAQTGLSLGSIGANVAVDAARCAVGRAGLVTSAISP